jgi:hypothetical protein
MSTTETVLVIAVVGVVAWLVMRQQDADKKSNQLAAEPGPVVGRGKFDFYAELSEDITGAITNLGASYAEAAKAEAKKT